MTKSPSPSSRLSILILPGHAAPLLCLLVAAILGGINSTITPKPLWQELPNSFILDVAGVLDPLLKSLLFSKKDRVKSLIVYSFTQILHLFFLRFKLENAGYHVQLWLRIFCHFPNGSPESMHRYFYSKNSQAIYATESWKNSSKACTKERYARKRKITWIHLHW